MISSSGITFELPENSTGVERVLGAIARLNGESRSSLVIFKIPRGTGGSDRLNPERVDEYIQVAGDAARMTIEQRSRYGGAFRHVVIGRISDGSPLSESILVSPGGTNTVFDNEVFNSKEASEIVTEYLENGSVSSDHSMRPI